MSQLADIEKAIITKLTGLTVDGEAVFNTLTGATGPVSVTLLQALLRERMPAAYVVFISEKLAPETDPTDLGPRFSLLLADRALRQTANPREGDPPSPGVFTMIDQTRALLDSYVPDGLSVTLTPIAQNSLLADARQAVVQLTYQARSSP